MVWAVISLSIVVSFWWASSDMRRVFVMRHTFIAHLIILGLKDYANKKQKKIVKTTESAATIIPLSPVAPFHESS